ncbi:MAG: MBL fold metallo-hydrolase [Lachnospiraceae bacterium]
MNKFFKEYAFHFAVGLVFFILAIGFFIYSITTENKSSTTSNGDSIETAISEETDVAEYDLNGITYTITQLPYPEWWGGAAYSIKTSTGKLFMYDGGFQDQDGQTVKEYILSEGGVVDGWIITHPHNDHVGAFLYNVFDESDDAIIIKNVYYSPFTAEYFDDPDPEIAEFLQHGSLFDSFDEAMTLYSDTVNFVPVYKGDVISLEDMTFTCLFSFMEEIKDVNTNSIVLLCEIKDFTMLFTGDMTDETIEYLMADYPDGLDVDALQIPHHGYMAGISNDALYHFTTPETCYLDCTIQEYKNNTENIMTHVEMIGELGLPVVMRFLGPNEIVIE